MGETKLRRLTSSHLYQPINRQLQLQVENSYLLYKNENGVIIGFWIHDRKYFDKICDEIKKMLYSINLHSTRVNTPNGKDPEISKMLRKVEEDNLRAKYGLKNLRRDDGSTKSTSTPSTPNSVAEFFTNTNGVDKELQAVTSSNNVTKFFANGVDKELQAVTSSNNVTKFFANGADKEYQTMSSNSVTKFFTNGDRELQTTTSNSVTKFFENASKVFKSNSKPVPVPVFNDNYQSTNVLKNLICNPQYNVESIEKNQRYSYVVDEM
ncbi:mRNA-decapping enzyme 1A-like [Planococcus citri]|uniref:mRNA-decapping enzyme 1A-like n=1 Tax=Planococcus citri TaxID=170843 RepID=UPI0031F7C7AF